MADVPHYCAACGEIHGGSTGRESDELKIAKVNAERDVEIARLAHSAERREAEAVVEVAEVQAEADVAEAVVEAEAQVAEAVVENEVLEEIVNPEPEPVVVVQQDAGPQEDEEAGTPPETAHVPAESSSGGFWDKYR